MQLSGAAIQLLHQLSTVVEQIKPEDYVRPSATLASATLGQHVRHTLEFFTCLVKGYDSGFVNYDSRRRDRLMETETEVAIRTIGQLCDIIQNEFPDKCLRLEVQYGSDCFSMETNLLRELTYNIEHAVHHMAVIRIGLMEVAPYVTLPSNFGVAMSTVRHRDSAEMAGR